MNKYIQRVTIYTIPSIVSKVLLASAPFCALHGRCVPFEGGATVIHKQIHHCRSVVAAGVTCFHPSLFHTASLRRPMLREVPMLEDAGLQLLNNMRKG